MTRRQRWTVGLLAATTLASLWLNALLYLRARQYYQWFNLVRLNPLDLNAFMDEGLGIATDEQPLLLFYGDSRAAAWPAPQGIGYAVVNRGVNGQSTTQLLQRFPHHVAPLEPDVVLIQAGINDLVGLAVLPDQQTEIVHATQHNLQALIDAALAIDATVIVTTIFPVGMVSPLDRLFWSGEVDAAVAAVNGALQTTDHPRVLLLDTHALLADDRGRTLDSYREDALHINKEGYAALNHALMELLAQLALDGGRIGD